MTVIQSNGRRAVTGGKAYPFQTMSSETLGPTAGYLPLLRGDRATTYEQIFRTQPILNAAIMKLVYGIARNPLKVYEYGLDGDSRERVRAHPAATLIKKPYPYGSEFMLKAKLALDLHVHGNALAVKVREAGAGSTPIELWPVPWRKVQVVRDEHDNVLGFAVTIDSETRTIGREEVIHLELPGGSPLQALRRTLALEDAAQVFQSENMRNGITKRSAFIADNRIPDAVIPRLREELSRFHSGVDNAGKTLILEGGLKPHDMGVSAVDMDVINQRKLSREEVCSVLDIPPQLLGLEKAAYSSVTEYRRGLFDAIATKLVLIEETVQAQLIDLEPAWDGIFVEFDTNELLRPDPETRARMHMLTQQAGVTTINERRRVENLAPINDPTADVVLAPLNMQPVGDQRDEVASMSLRERVDAAGVLIRSGFSAADALRVVGLPEMDYLQVRPVTVQPLALDATQIDGATGEDPQDVVGSDAGGTPSQGQTSADFLVRAITEAFDRPKARRIERDELGNISRIIEE